MLIEKKPFGEHEGKKIYSYLLDNQNGLVAEILNYGGVVRKLIYKGIDVVLGYDTLKEYIEGETYFGAIVGRNANRIENAEFEINGEIFKLKKNDENNNHHGGELGYSYRVWDARVIESVEPSLELSLFSEDGEEGFPGNANITVTYTITCDNSLKIHYEGTADKDTVINMTNHSYFNLNGHDSGAIYGHTFWLNSNFFTPNTDEYIPNGEILSTKGTSFDFSTETVLKQGFEFEHEQTSKFGGFDHNFVFNGKGYRRVGKLCGDKSGICMEVYTDQCGAQIYTGNGLDGKVTCKDGVKYDKHWAICIETQAFPNSLKFSHFPEIVLKKGEKYNSVTVYRFV